MICNTETGEIIINIWLLVWTTYLYDPEIYEIIVKDIEEVPLGNVKTLKEEKVLD